MPGIASRENGRKGGRPKGTVNKATAEVRVAAQKHTADAIATLVALMKKGKSEQARIMAARELLDRGHGKPAQAITGEGGTGPVQIVVSEVDERL